MKSPAGLLNDRTVLRQRSATEFKEQTKMKNRIVGVIFLTVFVLINLWAILTKNYSNSFLAGIAGMCLVTAIFYLRKEKK